MRLKIGCIGCTYCPATVYSAVAAQTIEMFVVFHVVFSLHQFVCFTWLLTADLTSRSWSQALKHLAKNVKG